MARRLDGILRAFGMSGLQITSNLNSHEQKFGVHFGHLPKQENSRKAAEYEQFEAELRVEAARMSELYEVFYCLENSIRKLVEDVVKEAEGANWWTSDRIDKPRIQDPVQSRWRKEVDSGITPRSERLIDYTTFGELAQIITDNWDLFDPIFQSKTAVSNVANQLNLLRGPIAHCNPTDELEVERLNLAVKTWFRIMS
jgi:hypothetical protein